MTPDLSDLRPRLSTYLDVEIARLAILGTGWETTIYEFMIYARSSRAPDLPVRSPLVLRLYDGPSAEDKAAREGATLSWLAAARYPVPRPYLREQSRAAMGAPFIVMDRVAGGPLFSVASFPLAFKTFAMGFIAFVRAQVRLHRLNLSSIDSPTPPNLPNPEIPPRASSDARLHRIDVSGPDSPVPSNPPHADELPRAYTCASISPAAPLLDRMLAIIAERVASGPLPGLADALTSLRERAARYRLAPEAIVHMDYHPQNVIVRGIRVNGVIDWVSADRGDRHLDAATTSMILATSAMDRLRWMRDNRVGNSLRALFAALYFPAYHALAPMELDRFRYCQAVAALFRLSTFGMMRAPARGPESVGFHPDAIAHVTPDAVRLLARYASRKSGLPVTLDPLH